MSHPLDEIARRALGRAQARGRPPTERRRHAVQALIVARPQLAAHVALRVVRRAEAARPHQPVARRAVSA
jgi:hypothetical protein